MFTYNYSVKLIIKQCSNYDKSHHKPLCNNGYIRVYSDDLYLNFLISDKSHR